MIKDLFLRRLLTSLVTFILVFGATVIATYAWFMQQEERSIVLQTGDFVVELLVSFDGTTIGPLSPYYDAERGVVIVNAYDDQSPNYIGNMQIDIAITPAIAARARIKVRDEWEVTRFYIDETGVNPIPPIVSTIIHEDPPGFPYLPYTILMFDPLFQGKTDENSFIYHQDILPTDQRTIIPLIDGGVPYPARSNLVFYEECYVYIDFYVDIVQANRVFEMWQIDSNFYDS